MTNKKLLADTIGAIAELIHDYGFKVLHRKSVKDFSRKGKIGFENTVMLLLNFFRKTSAVEIYNFFERILKTDKTVSRQAFEKARQKISHTAFKAFFDKTVEKGLATIDPRLYMGYRLLAIDGSTLMLENSIELKEHFGATTPSEGDIFARISMVMDVLNGFIVDAAIEPFSKGERAMAIEHMAKLKTLNCKKRIVLLDRGYWSPELVTRLCENEGKFLMRVACNVSKTIKKSSSKSGFFNVKHQEKTNRLRFHKLTLTSGQQEILVTNLDSAEMPDEKLCELYSMRWGVETKYRELKVMLQMENFTGKTVLTVLQDFYTTIFLSNVVAFAKLQSDEIIADRVKERKLKHPCKTNTNITIGILKDRLIMAMTAKNPMKRLAIINGIMKVIAENYTVIRPNRSYPRKQSSIKYRKRTVTKLSL